MFPCFVYTFVYTFVEMVKEKDTTLVIRISTKKKADFQKAVKKLERHASSLIREYIDKIIKENK